MRTLIILLLIVFSLSRIIGIRKEIFPVEKVKVIKVEYYRSKNITDNHVEKIMALDIPQKVKDWVKKQDINKYHSKEDIELNWNETNGGSAKGDVYSIFNRKLKENSQIIFNFGSAEATLKPNLPQTEKRCYGFGKKKKCRNITISKKLKTTDVKQIVKVRMKHEIEQVIMRKIRNEELRNKYNKTK